MQLSKTTEYAIRAVVYLTIHPDIQRLEDIALEMDIPKGYLIKILNKLKAGGIVQVYRGVNGGFSLNMPAKNVRLYDVMNVTEKTLKINSCMESGKCALTGTVPSCRMGTFDIYCQLQNVFETKIKEVTIADLATNLKKQQEM